MEPLKFGSTAGTRISLSLADRPRWEWPDQFTVRVEATGIESQVTVEHPSWVPANASLTAFFTELGQSVSGWTGTREWRSAERELAIRASIDRTGHVTLEFELSPSFGAAESWRVVARVILELGSLAGIARMLEEMFAYERP